MSNPCARFAFALVALAASGLATPLVAAPAGQEPPHAFVSKARPADAALPSRAKPGTGGRGRFDAAALHLPVIQLTLPDGRTVQARQSHVARDARRQSWRGAVVGDGGPRGHLTVTLYEGRLAAVLELDDERWEFVPDGTGGTLAYAVDPARQPRSDEPVAVPLPMAARMGAAVTPPTTAEAGVVHDVLVLVSSAARARRGSALDAAIANAVERANAAYRAGSIDLTLNLVDIGESALVEGPNTEDTLQRLRNDAAARAARDAAGADVVVLVADHPESCGIAYLMTDVTGSFAPFAYGLVSETCIGDVTLAHEIGHVQGLAHDRETAGANANASRPYAFGYRVCVSGSGVRDIMSYPCTNGVFVARTNEFSNPRRTVNGRPFGVDYESNPANAADAARALGENAAVVADFRQSVLPVPSAPASLTATHATGSGRVVLSWTDASTQESGHRVERSTDGTNWTEIAQLAADVTSYVDATVAAGATYSYRVRAFNASGVSDASNVATVTVPTADATPDPISFQNLADVVPATVVTSNAVTVTGIDVEVPISVTGGEYSVGCNGTFTSVAGTITAGASVCVRHTSSSAYSTATTTTLTVGTLSATFTSTTRAAPAPPPPPNDFGGGGGSGGGGAADPRVLMALLALVAAAQRRRRTDFAT